MTTYLVTLNSFIAAGGQDVWFTILAGNQNQATSIVCQNLKKIGCESIEIADEPNTVHFLSWFTKTKYTLDGSICSANLMGGKPKDDFIGEYGLTSFYVCVEPASDLSFDKIFNVK